MRPALASLVIVVALLIAGWSISAWAQGSRPGDVDGDGRVNSIDAFLLLGYRAGTILDPGFDAKHDVNCDGLANAQDATLILQFHARLLPAFSVCLYPLALHGHEQASLLSVPPP